MQRRSRAFGADEIEARLAKKFAAPEWAFMPQLNQGTGRYAGRRADAVALSLWPSRGIRLHGFEIKVSRNDFLRELKDPEKADQIQRFCDHWWIVTPANVVLATDLFPSAWGHMEMSGRFLVKRKAPDLSPEPLGMPQIAAMFRAFSETVPYLKDAYIPRADIEAEVERRVGIRLERSDPAIRQLRELQEKVSAFEKASGLEIEHGWRTEPVGEAVKLLLDSQAMKSLHERIDFDIARLRAALRELERVRELET